MTDFKVGDKVEGLGAGWLGRQGTVTDNSGNLWEYTVEDSKGRVGLFHAHELKLVQPKRKFKVGAIVKSVGFQYAALKNTTLIVDHLNEGESPYVYAVRALGEDYEKGHNFRENELELDDTGLAEWEIELLDSSRPSLKSDTYGLSAKDEAWAQANKKGEAVKHPAHYGGGDNTYEAIKVIEAWGLGFNLGNAAKYLARAGKKGNKVEDLKKLIQYVQFEIAKEETK